MRSPAVKLLPGVLHPRCRLWCLHPRCHLNPREYPLRIAEGGHRKVTVTVSLLQRDNSFCCCTLGVSGPYNHSKFMIKHLGIVTENECKKK